MIRRGSRKFACVVCAAIASSTNHTLQCYPHLSCMARGRQARGRQWRARLRVKYTFDYRHKGPLSDPTRVETVARRRRRHSIVWPQNVTPIRQFAVCVMSRLLGSANEYAVLGIRRAWAPFPLPLPLLLGPQMVAQPVQIVQVVPAQPATFPTSANVTNLMCFASIKPQHARVWGPTIMWCAVPSFSCRVKSSAKRRYSIPKPKKLAMKKFAVLRKLSNLINIILNFGFTLRGIFTMKMKIYEWKVH